MTREQIIRARLVELVDALLARYAGRLLAPEHPYEEPRLRTWGGHDVPDMSAADTRAMNELVDALLRIDAGNYDTCGACGNVIGFQRLHESPTTQLCEICAQDEGWRPSSPG